MRIGILTFHQSVNNGAVMQAYSLSRKLRELYPSCEVEIIDYRMKKVQESYAYSLSSYFANSSPKQLIKKCLLLLRDPFLLRRKRKRTEIFSSCLNKLPLSPECIVDNGTDKAVSYINERYDVLVVGSDAIWNYVTRGFGNVYLPSREVTCKKFSYAASCYGMDFLKRPDNERSQIKVALDDFSFIGVRDKATEDFVKWSGCDITPAHTCDPTVFLNVDDLPIDQALLRQKLEKRGFDFSKPAIGMMGTPNMMKMIRKMYGSTYQIVALYEHIPGADVNLYDLQPYEWAFVFRYFAMTFTTYFHGTLLSLRNGTPVICVALDTEFAKTHTPKTLDVLTRLGFPQWYFKTDYQKQNIDAIKRQADDFLVNDYRREILDAMDKEAQSFDTFNAVFQQFLK